MDEPEPDSEDLELRPEVEVEDLMLEEVVDEPAVEDEVSEEGPVELELGAEVVDEA